MIIVSDVVSLKERGKYQGVTGTIVVLSNSLGPLIGARPTFTVYLEVESLTSCFSTQVVLSRRRPVGDGT